MRGGGGWSCFSSCISLCQPHQTLPDPVLWLGLAQLNMLVFMTFNVGLCVAMVLGSSVGFALTSRTMDFGSAAGLSADCHV